MMTHFLLDNRHSYPFTPDYQLFHRSGTEGIGSSQIHRFSGFLELISQFTDGSGLSHSVHSYHHDHIRLLAFGYTEVFGVHRIVFGEQGRNFLTQDIVQFLSIDILVAGHSVLNSLDDIQRGLHSYVRSDQHFFQVVQYFIVYFRLSGYCAGYLPKDTFLGFRQSFVQRFFLFLREKTKKSHTRLVIYYLFCDKDTIFFKITALFYPDELLFILRKVAQPEHST